MTHCTECGVALIADDQPLPPRVDARLGTFHPTVAGRIVDLLESRRIAHEQAADGDAIRLLVDRRFRDDLRTELAMSWSDIVGRLPEEEMYDVLSSGGRQPGWFDAPQGAWVDRAGRIQMDPGHDEEAEHDAGRVLGPSLLTVGVVLLLFGWYAGPSPIAILTGIAALLLGAFLPR